MEQYAAEILLFSSVFMLAFINPACFKRGLYKTLVSLNICVFLFQLDTLLLIHPIVVAALYAISMLLVNIIGGYHLWSSQEKEENTS